MKAQIDKETQISGIKVLIILLVLCIIIVVGILYLKNWNTTDPGLTLITCISNNSKLYVSSVCPHCNTQEQEFASYLYLFNVTDCFKDTNTCIKLNVSEVPTWIINNKTYTGIKSINELENLTGC